MVVPDSPVGQGQIKLSTTSGGHNFSYSHRLHQHDEFDDVFQNTDIRINHSSISVLAKRNTLQCNRLGIILGKKTLAKAVARNSIKRQIREIFRQNVTGKSFTLQSLDILVLCKPNINKTDRQTLRNVLLSSFDKLATKALLSP